MLSLIDSIEVSSKGSSLGSVGLTQRNWNLGGPHRSEGVSSVRRNGSSAIERASCDPSSVDKYTLTAARKETVAGRSFFSVLAVATEVTD